MVRINIIPVEELTDQHLRAEYVEILMLCQGLKRTLNSKNGFVKERVPERYTLNTGHMYFFYNKGKYLRKRFLLVKREMVARGFNPVKTFPRSVWTNNLWKDWKPNKGDFEIIKERIKQKIALKPKWYKKTQRT